MALPEKFEWALVMHSAYPGSLVRRTIHTYPEAMSVFRDHLDRNEGKVFEKHENKWRVIFRDLVPDAKFKFQGASVKNGLVEHAVRDSNELSRWLGIQQNPTGQPSSHVRLISTAKHKDPKCRFIYIYAMHSGDYLKLSREMLTRILTFHQVMPEYLEFMLAFGVHEGLPEWAFPGFREQLDLQECSRTVPIPSLGRSGQQFQLCYNLKNIYLNSKDEDLSENEVYIQQAAIYHQFDVMNGKALWIVTKGGQRLQGRIQELTGEDARKEDKNFSTVEDSFRSTLSAHFVFCHWSTENWHFEISYLQENINYITSLSFGGQTQLEILRPRDLHSLHKWMAQAHVAAIAIEGNVDVICSLSKFYGSLLCNRNFPLNSACAGDIEAFTEQLDELARHLTMKCKQAKSAAERAQHGIQQGRRLVWLMISKLTHEQINQYVAYTDGQLSVRFGENIESMTGMIGLITLVALVFPPATLLIFMSPDSARPRWSHLVALVVFTALLGGISLRYLIPLIQSGGLPMASDQGTNPDNTEHTGEDKPIGDRREHHTRAPWIVELPSASTPLLDRSTSGNTGNTPRRPDTSTDPSPNSESSLTYIEDLAKALSRRNIPIPIASEHQRLTNRDQASSHRVQQPEDLKRFCEDRNFIFVLDNSSTMREHWYHASLVLDTLVMKLASINRSDVSLIFTLSGSWDNIRNTRASKAPTLFRDQVHTAMAPSDKLETHMFECLSYIYDEFNSRSEKSKMTLVILTDGMWRSSSLERDPVSKTIQLVKNLERSGELRARDFTIQFISFGDNKNGLNRIKDMKDRVLQETSTPDIIDVEPWVGVPDKMLLGSVQPGEDNGEARQRTQQVECFT